MKLPSQKRSSKPDESIGRRINDDNDHRIVYMRFAGKEREGKHRQKAA